jgi:hypothetical protein
MMPAAIDGDHRESLVFTDDALEHSTIIEALLDIIYYHKVLSLDRATLIVYLIKLADKWDIPLVNESIKDQIKNSLTSAVITHSTFSRSLSSFEITAWRVGSSRSMSRRRHLLPLPGQVRQITVSLPSGTTGFRHISRTGTN